MRFGLLLSFDLPAQQAGHNAWDLVLDQCRAAESAGFDAVWVPSEIGWTRMEGLSLLGAIAASTQRVRLGSLVLLSPLYSPLHVAEAAATIDQVSHGRLVLGLGMGWRKAEFDAAGIPLEARLSRFREGIPLIRRLLAGEVVDHQGRNFRCEGVTLGNKPVQTEVPVWIGAHSRRAVKRAASLGDAWIGGPFQTLAEVRERYNIFRDGRQGPDGFSPRFPLVRDAMVGSPSDIEQHVRPHLIHKYQEYAVNVGGMPFDERGPFEAMAKDRLIAGTPEQCAQEISRYAQEGVTDLILRVQYRGMDPRRANDTIRMFGNEVIPQYRRLS